MAKQEVGKLRGSAFGKKSERTVEVMSCVYGYARVSTRDQNEERQLIALREFPVPEQRIFVDKVSGASFERPAYRRMMRRLRTGDVLVVKSIDRLGRNYAEILDQWRYLTKERSVALVVLDTPLLDTRSTQGGLTGVFIADLVLQILSYVAETERDNIRQRQAEGIAAARARGARFGRPPKPVPEGFDDVCAAWREGSLSGRAAARTLGVSPSTFRKWAQETE